MIFFDACAVRAIVTAVTLLVGLSAPPILFDKTTKLLSQSGFFSSTELSTAPSDLKLLSQDSGFTLSLEWSLFRPNGQCADEADVLNVRSVFAVPSYEVVDSSLVERVSERTAQLSPVYNNLNLLSPDKVFTLSLEWSLFQPNSRCFVEKTDEQLVESVRESTHLFINSFLDLNATTLHPLPIASHSVTGPFVMTTPLPLLPQPICYGFEQILEMEPEYPIEIDAITPHSVTRPFVMTTRLPLLPQPIDYGFNHTTEVNSGCLAYLKQLKLYIRELILNSLPAYWAEWTTHNRLTLGLICVSVMYGSLLCPILHYLWTQNNINKRLSEDLKVVCGLKLSVDLQLFKITMERNALNGTKAVQLKDLLDLKTQLRQCQLQEVEAQERLVLTKEELKKEKWDGGNSRRRIYSEHATVLAEVNKKLEKTQRSLSWFQILECKAQMELKSLQEKLDEERQQRNNKEMTTTELFIELQQDLQKTKYALKGNLEVTQQKLRLATDKAIQLKIRLSESVMNDSGMDANDSGIFESLSANKL